MRCVPVYSMIANHRYPRTGRAWVPVDDYNVMTFGYSFNAERPFTEHERAVLRKGAFFPPRITPGAWKLDDGYIIDTFIPDANAGNDYLMDRDIQRSGNYTGILGVNEQDRCIQESQRSMPGLRPGGLVDRSRERLVASDVPVITARKTLLKMIDDLEKGIEPPQISNPGVYNVHGTAILSRHAEFDGFLREHAPELGAYV